MKGRILQSGDEVSKILSALVKILTMSLAKRRHMWKNNTSHMNAHHVPPVNMKNRRRCGVFSFLSDFFALIPKL